MTQRDLIFKFVILGESKIYAMLIPARYNSPIEVEIVSRHLEIYDAKFSGSFFVPKYNMANFMKPGPGGALISFFGGFSGVIFTSISFSDTKELLQETNRDDLFRYITDGTPIYVLTMDATEVNRKNDYHELFKQYFSNITYNVPKIFVIGEDRDLETPLKQVLFDYILDYGKTHTKEINLTVFGLCAICREEKEQLYVPDNFVICRDCNPEDYNEDKVRAWLRLDRRG